MDCFAKNGQGKIAQLNPFDMCNVAYLIDSFSALNDDMSRWDYANLLENLLDTEDNNVLDDYLEEFGEDEIYPLVVKSFETGRFMSKEIYAALGGKLNTHGAVHYQHPVPAEEMKEEFTQGKIDSMLELLSYCDEQITWRNLVKRTKAEIKSKTQSPSYEQPSSSREPSLRSRPELRIV